MAIALGKAVALAALCGAAAVCNIALGDEGSDASAGQPAPTATNQDEIIVIGRLGELRHKLELAEGAVYDRFNEINSTDKFDIHCRSEQVIDSHIPRRSCKSNSWHDEDANYAQSTLHEIRGEYGGNPEEFHARQLYMQGLLEKEIRRLAAKDAALGQALSHLGEVQEEYAKQTGASSTLTRSLQVAPGAEGLPFGARQMFEVLVGREPWGHLLTQRTFTIAQVTGDIRALRLECDHGTRQLEYKDGVDWTVPAGWGDCTVLVRAKSQTTFAFYEFE